MTGLLLVDKPAGMTSHDVVDRIRKATGIRRVGHTGTLDPSATGLLILCIGKATRLSEHLTGLDKTYEGVMRLGVETTTHDMDGEVVAEHPVPDLSIDDLQQVCDKFTGEIEQIPPMVSAVKVGGQRLYKMARKGETVERKARKIGVWEFKVNSYEPPEAKITVRCVRGTYVRTLCHDVGQELGCGAALASLRRTSVGKHAVDHAQSLDALEDRDSVRENLLDMGEALDLPAVVVRGSSRKTLGSGGTLRNNDLLEPCPVNKGWVQIKDKDGRLLALGTVDSTVAGATIHPKRVLETA